MRMVARDGFVGADFDHLLCRHWLDHGRSACAVTRDPRVRRRCRNSIPRGRHRRDIGVIEGAGGLGFMLEAGCAGAIAYKLLGQDPEGNVAAEPGIAGAIHFAPTAHSQTGADDIWTRMVACRECRSVRCRFCYREARSTSPTGLVADHGPSRATV